jgi:phospho-N-acetylmuramoyl-pentapeptide-transferase
VGFGFLGFLDDYLKLIKKKNEGLSVKQKFFGELFISFLVGALIVYFLSTTIFVPFKWTALLDLSYFYIPFAMFIIISWSNAVNLTDGLDGLAGGLSGFLIIAIGFFCYFEGNSFIASYFNIPFIQGVNDIAIFSSAILGAISVFLWYNFYPAQIFMGDTGSLALGAFIGATSLILKKEILIAIAGVIFIVEIISVVLQVLYYKRTKKRLFRMAPLHHHFELLGIPESKIVIRFWLIGIFLVLIVVGSLRVT